MIIFFFRLVLCLFQRDTRRLGGCEKRVRRESACAYVCVCVCKRMWQMCARGEADNIRNEGNKSTGEVEKGESGREPTRGTSFKRHQMSANYKNVHMCVYLYRRWDTAIVNSHIYLLHTYVHMYVHSHI